MNAAPARRPRPAWHRRWPRATRCAVLLAAAAAIDYGIFGWPAGWPFIPWSIALTVAFGVADLHAGAAAYWRDLARHGPAAPPPPARPPVRLIRPGDTHDGQRYIPPHP